MKKICLFLILIVAKILMIAADCDGELFYIPGVFPDICPDSHNRKRAVSDYMSDGDYGFSFDEVNNAILGVVGEYWVFPTNLGHVITVPEPAVCFEACDSGCSLMGAICACWPVWNTYINTNVVLPQCAEGENIGSDGNMLCRASCGDNSITMVEIGLFQMCHCANSQFSIFLSAMSDFYTQTTTCIGDILDDSSDIFDVFAAANGFNEDTIKMMVETMYNELYVLKDCMSEQPRRLVELDFPGIRTIELGISVTVNGVLEGGGTVGIIVGSDNPSDIGRFFISLFHGFTTSLESLGVAGSVSVGYYTGISAIGGSQQAYYVGLGVSAGPVTGDISISFTTSDFQGIAISVGLSVGASIVNMPVSLSGGWSYDWWLTESSPSGSGASIEPIDIVPHSKINDLDDGEIILIRHPDNDNIDYKYICWADGSYLTGDRIILATYGADCLWKIQNSGIDGYKWIARPDDKRIKSLGLHTYFDARSGGGDTKAFTNEKQMLKNKEYSDGCIKDIGNDKIKTKQCFDANNNPDATYWTIIPAIYTTNLLVVNQIVAIRWQPQPFYICRNSGNIELKNIGWDESCHWEIFGLAPYIRFKSINSGKYLKVNSQNKIKLSTQCDEWNKKCKWNTVLVTAKHSMMEFRETGKCLLVENNLVNLKLTDCFWNGGIGGIHLGSSWQISEIPHNPL